MLFGAHRGTTGGLHNALASGDEIGCDAVQIFTTSPRQWKARPLTDEALEAWHSARAAAEVQAVVAHDSYLINLAAADEALREKSRAAFDEELERCHRLGIPYVVSHPGAHVGAGEAAGLATFADTLKALHEARPDREVMTLLETTAGQGTCLGHTFEHLAELLERLDLPERIGVCLDTCHIFAAGYDIRDADAYADTMRRFDAIIGIERLKVVHLNDSKTDLGSRVDRHEQIGEGTIGDEGFRCFVTDPRLAGLPMVIETPDLDKHGDNLARLRRLAANGE